MPQNHHRRDATVVRCAVITVSDTRTIDSDQSGREIVGRLQASGHEVVRRAIVPDGPEVLVPLLDELSVGVESEAILITGGTGFGPRDLTPQIVTEKLDLTMSGFGELFRSISARHIGPKAMLSRAVAGRMGKQAVFVMPGSSGAVRTAMDELILPTLGHFVAQIRGS